MAQLGTLDSFDSAGYFGVAKEAMPEWRALLKAQEENIHYPCLQNPYYYMDYTGWGLTEDEGKYYNEPITEDVAEQLCHGCPLIKQCYDFAVANEETFGIWGGINFGLEEDQLF